MASIKLISVVISCILLLNLYFQTTSDPLFQKIGKSGFEAILSFHFKYPEGLILYALTIFLPALYFGFIRGVRFHENGVIINRGLPFFNMMIPYDVIERFEIIDQKYYMAIFRKDTEDEYMFTINDIDRVLAIFDQHHIKGDLGQRSKPDKSAHLKLVLFFMLAGILLAIFQYSGFLNQVLR
ncbi:hypothetical protein HOB30_00255 [Candidatus Falkowbacteria bacterium]|nr:hypothetical protein [Candidatus Falkowbacteria bacterium]